MLRTEAGGRVRRGADAVVRNAGVLVIAGLALSACARTAAPVARPAPAPSACTSPDVPTNAQRAGAPLPPGTPTSTWGGLSGASGSGVADGTFGTWRGTPVSIAGTWNDTAAAQVLMCTIRPGFEYGAWNRDLDLAVGAIYHDRGETWAAAAKGAYDSRWLASLTTIRAAWGARAGTLHLRFAHEFNGDWVPWSVRGGEEADFISAWKRYRTLQREVLPAARLVFCPNDGSSPSLDLDWRAAFPGSSFVDETAVDSYNQRDFSTSADDFAAKIDKVDDRGAPIGIEQHRRWAESVGLPMAVSEWSSDADNGDAPVFVEQFHAWLSDHHGTGPGQVPYEILFNVGDFNDGVFELFPTTRQPQAAGAYVRLF